MGILVFLFWLKYGPKTFFDIGQIKDWYMMLIQAILYLVFLSEIDPRWPIEGGCDLSSQASQHLAIHLRLRYMKKPSITNFYRDISHRAIYLCQRYMKKPSITNFYHDISHRAIHLRLRYMKKPSITNLYHDISHRAIYLCQRYMYMKKPSIKNCIRYWSEV